MQADIRDKPYIRSEDITGLNFIKDSGSYVFRKHCREGLRSRIMEVLDANDTRKERTDQIIDGIRWFPRARPLSMLRIFVNRINISTLNSEVKSSPESGAAIYSMTLLVEIPKELSLQTVEDGLNRIGDQLNVDVTIE